MNLKLLTGFITQLAMVGFGLKFVLLLLVQLAVASNDGTKNSEKLSVMAKESLIVANAIGNLTITDAASKVQIVGMASDFIISLNYATHSLNNVIRNIVKEKEYPVMVSVIVLLSNVANDVQQALTRESENLKRELVVALGKIHEAAVEDLAVPSDMEDPFLTNQVTRYLNFIIYSIYKLKYRVLYFEKSSKELVPEMQKSMDLFIEATLSLLANPNTTEEALRLQVQTGSLLTAKNVYKLDNWIEANPNRTDDVKFAKDLSRALGECYGDQSDMASVSRGSSRLRAEFVNIYQRCLSLGMQLSNIKSIDNSIGGELIRSSMFDVITIGRVIFKSVIKVNLSSV